MALQGRIWVVECLDEVFVAQECAEHALVIPKESEAGSGSKGDPCKESIARPEANTVGKPEKTSTIAESSDGFNV